jgi:hypothetical protein
MICRMTTDGPPCVRTLEYLAEVAKDWTVSAFAAAEAGDFALPPHRFEFRGSTVRRRRLPPASREAADPLGAVRTSRRPIVWAHAATLTLMADCVAYDQEIVEVLGVEGDEVFATAASVVRIPGLPPCLGSFWTVA